MSLLIKKNFKRIPGGLNLGLSGESQMLNPLHCQDDICDLEKYKNSNHNTISIHILAGKFKIVLHSEQTQKMSDLDALIGLTVIRGYTALCIAFLRQ